MVVGIIAQLVCGVVFFAFISLIYWRGRRHILANKKLLLCSAAIAFSTTMMNLRGFYRSVELLQGWTGYLITHEMYVIGLDAIPMVLAMAVLAILSPGPLLVNERRKQLEEKSRIMTKAEHDGTLSGENEKTLTKEESVAQQV